MTDNTENNKAPAKKAADKVACTILRDFWDADGKRHPAGTIVEVDVNAALDGVEAGTLRRVK